ncbi:MAG TPA: outer membrane beta-barrel protein [Chthoniobacterales bacterium]|nr:outer membrane beta-barrel protein [Chthoniobacterales bacterium]
MKPIWFGAFVLAIAQAVLAGPSALQNDKKAVVMPQEAKESCNWTGFYIGGSIGGAFDRVDLDLDLNGLWDTRLPFTRDVGQDLGSRDLEANGLIAGGFLGYNYQWNNWVLGLEGGFDYLGLRDSFNSGYQFVGGDGGNVIALRQSFETHYLATLGPRFGYSWNRILFYTTGGVAFTDLRFSQELNELDNGMRQEGSSDDVEVGWTVGGGLEYCLARHWSVRVEYRYNDFECADFSTSAVPRPGVPNAPSGFTGHHEACLSFHSVTAGLAYKF